MRPLKQNLKQYFKDYLLALSLFLSTPSRLLPTHLGHLGHLVLAQLLTSRLTCLYVCDVSSSPEPPVAAQPCHPDSLPASRHPGSGKLNCWPHERCWNPERLNPTRICRTRVVSFNDFSKSSLFYLQGVESTAWNLCLCRVIVRQNSLVCVCQSASCTLVMQSLIQLFTIMDIEIAFGSLRNHSEMMKKSHYFTEV